MKKKLTPFLLFILAIVILVVVNQPIIAGAFMVVGLTMILSWIFPDKKDSNENKQ